MNSATPTTDGGRKAQTSPGAGGGKVAPVYLLIGGSDAGSGAVLGARKLD